MGKCGGRPCTCAAGITRTSTPPYTGCSGGLQMGIPHVKSHLSRYQHPCLSPHNPDKQASLELPRLGTSTFQEQHCFPLFALQSEPSARYRVVGNHESRSVEILRILGNYQRGRSFAASCGAKSNFRADPASLPHTIFTGSRTAWGNRDLTLEHWS